MNEAVEKSGLTLQEISTQTQISVRSLKDYFAGKRYPKTMLLFKMQKALGVGFDYLLCFPEILK